MTKTTLDQDLFTDVTPLEETQVAGGLGYSGFRMHTARIQVVPVADVTPQSSGSPGGYGRRGGEYYFDLQAYIFGMGAAYLFGNVGVTPAEVQYVWQMALKLR